MRFILDNQFKSLKTHARLSSRALWYEFRRALLSDLQSGLLHIEDGMRSDEVVVSKLEEILAAALPGMMLEHERLSDEHEELALQAQELASSNQEQLSDARKALLALDAEVTAKKARVESLRGDIRAKQEEIEASSEQKMVLTQDIRRAQKIREECRGWTAAEVKKWMGMVKKFASPSLRRLSLSFHP